MGLLASQAATRPRTIPTDLAPQRLWDVWLISEALPASHDALSSESQLPHEVSPALTPKAILLPLLCLQASAQLPTGNEVLGNSPVLCFPSSC